jgi:Metal binding domain of Ada
MRLANIVEKINSIRRLTQNILTRTLLMPDLPKDIFVLSMIFLVGIGAFLLGKVSAEEDKRVGELRIVASTSVSPSVREVKEVDTEGSAQKEATASKGMYVGSRSGTTYHLPWCSGAKRILEENKVWFQTKEEAETSGYKPASNCKGI